MGAQGGQISYRKKVYALCDACIYAAAVWGRTEKASLEAYVMFEFNLIKLERIFNFSRGRKKENLTYRIMQR
jgi:hypothetical protein